MVVIQDGRVVANKTSLNAGKLIQGAVLVGRGPGAAQLTQLRVGSLASVQLAPAGRPGDGDQRREASCCTDGKRQREDDSELHPRTAVGIDRDPARSCCSSSTAVRAGAAATPWSSWPS